MRTLEVMGHFHMCFGPKNSLVHVIQVGPKPNEVCIDRYTTVPVGTGAGGSWESLSKGLWNVALAGTLSLLYCGLQSPALSAHLSSLSLPLLPLCVPPFSVLHNQQALLTLDLCSLCPLLGRLCLQTLVHYSLHIM